jgi:hypothetical protein
MNPRIVSADRRDGDLIRCAPVHPHSTRTSSKILRKLRTVNRLQLLLQPELRRRDTVGSLQVITPPATPQGQGHDHAILP